MTAFCGGGTSAPKPGVDGIVQISAEVAGSLIGAEFGPIGADVLGTLAAMQAPIITNNFCAGEPPADPHITQTDLFNAAQLYQPLVSGPAILRLGQWIQCQLWPLMCECTSGTTPPITTTPIPPTQIIPAPGGGTVTGQPCWTQIYSGTVPAGNGNGLFTGLTNVTQQLMPSYWLAAGNSVPGITDAWIIPANDPTIYQADATLTVDSVPVNGVQFNVNEYSPGWTGEYSVTLAPGSVHSGVTTGSESFGLPPTPWNQAPRRLQVNNDDTTPHTFTVKWTIWCNPPAPATPCCPPDPALQTYLDRILGIVQQILADQGASTTPGYKLGTQHTGLSGSGSLTVNDIVGVQVAITAKPPTRVIEGNPPYIYDMGWMSILTVDGMIEEKRISRDSQIWLPVSGRLATTVGYFLNSGVTANITELVPGP